MKKLRYVLAAILTLGLAFPGVALADDDDDSDSDGRRCSQIGTWLGIVDRDDPTLTGAMWTTMGKTENRGTNLLQQVNNPDPTLGGFFPTGVRTSMFRGNWFRTGKRTFLYTLTGYVVDDMNMMVGIVRFRGDVTQSRDCQYEYVTAMVDVWYPPASPFRDDPFASFPFLSQWGKRAHVVVQ